MHNRKQWKGYELVLDNITALPDNQQCYRLSDKTVAMLLTQTNYFHWFTRWHKDGELTDSDKALIISLASQVEHELLDGGICDAPLPSETDCTDYTPEAPFISYAPQDPFTQPDTIPVGYVIPPFYHNPLIPLPGVLPGDAMVNFLSLPIFAHLPDIITSGFPRIHLSLSGAGRVTLTLVSIAQGGVALITVDGSPDNSTIVDLNYFSFFDSSAFDDLFDVVVGGVTDNTVIHEANLIGSGAHYIDITFLPSVSASELLGFGGGLRTIELCGDITFGTYAMPEITLDGCILKWRPNSSAAWSTLGNVCGADGANGTNGTNGLTPLITVDDSTAHHHKVLLALSDNPTDTVQIADILDGVDGTCPDCPPILAQDLCRFAWATVNGMWLAMDAMLNDLLAYKTANPGATYIAATAAIFAGIGFGANESALQDFIQSVYSGDTISAFITIQSENLATLACGLFKALTADFIGDTELVAWSDNVAPCVGDDTSFMLLVPTLAQFRTWETGQYPSTAPADCTTCEDCVAPETWTYRWDFSIGSSNWVSSPLDGSGWGSSYSAGCCWEGGSNAIAYHLPDNVHITSLVDATNGGTHMAYAPSNDVPVVFTARCDSSGGCTGIDWTIASGNWIFAFASEQIFTVTMSGIGAHPALTGGSFI